MDLDTTPGGAALGCDVRDGSGRRLGSLGALYTDLDSGRVVFAAVTVTRYGRRRNVYAPIGDARMQDRGVLLRCGGRLVLEAPSVRPGLDLPADREAELYEHYELAYPATPDGTRRLVALRRR